MQQGAVQPLFLRDKGPYVLIVVLVLLWTLLCFAGPKVPSEVDVFGYKEAGVNLALGQGLAKRLNPSATSLSIEPYGSYPPLFPFAFGLYTSVAGIGSQKDLFFEICLSTVLCLLLYQMFSKSFNGAASRFFIALALFGPLIYMPIIFERERPDRLGALIVAAAAWLSLNDRPRLRQIGSAACLILSCFTSPYFFILTAAALLILGVIRENSRTIPWRAVFSISAVSLASIAALIFVQFVNSSAAARTFLNFLVGRRTSGTTGIGYFKMLLHGDIAGYLDGFSKLLEGGRAMAFIKLAYFALTVGLVGVAAIYARMKKSNTQIVWMLTLLTLLATVTIFIRQINYYMGANLLALLAFAGAAMQPGEDRRMQNCCKASLLALLACAAASSSLIGLRYFCLAHAMAPSLSRAETVVASLQDLNHDGEIIVATYSPLYYLFKEKGMSPIFIEEYPPMFRADFIDPNETKRVDYYCFPYLGSGDLMKPMMPDEWEVDSYSRIFEPQLPQQQTYLGRKSNSSCTWEPAVYARKQ